MGKSLLSTLYPKDFEYYLIAFELVDHLDQTVDYFTFPVMPSQISVGENFLSNIKLSAGGITALDTDLFLPRSISLSGNFGRNFKFLLNGTDFRFAGLRFSTQAGVYTKEDVGGKKIKVTNVPFSPQIKSGYGCIKILESILDKSRGTDSGKPFHLYFYNPTLGHSFLVKPRSAVFRQEENLNMIWQYDIQLEAIAPLEQIRHDNQASLVRNLGIDTVNKKVGELVQALKN
jgi:hypothetical protein